MIQSVELLSSYRPKSRRVNLQVQAIERWPFLFLGKHSLLLKMKVIPAGLPQWLED